MIKYSLATNEDREQLLNHFKHYTSKEVLETRVECYINHNFTVVAKDNGKIVGVLQWYVKEEPQAGLVEFEEVFVLKDYRGQGIGFELTEFAIQSVKDYFKKIKIKLRKIYLFVSEDAEAAIHLYEKLGFKFISKVGDLFEDNKEELFYVLSVK